MVSDSEARSIGEQAPSGFAMPVDEYEIGGASDHPESSEVEIPCAFAGAWLEQGLDGGVASSTDAAPQEERFPSSGKH